MAIERLVAVAAALNVGCVFLLPAIIFLLAIIFLYIGHHPG